MADYQYKAFISYSHRDTRWAQWLLQALETYGLPDIKVRGVGKIFRDRDEAGAATDLKDEIQRALLASEHLIVIASPNSARSVYVEAEIEAFATANAMREAPGKILTLIVDGEPNVFEGTDAARECFPPSLRGGLRKPDGGAFEPLAADARPVGDGKTRALAKLVAGLMDIRYDALVRRDLTRRRQSRLLAAAAAAGVVVIAGAVAALIVTGNIEQDRLRAASESAARDARTVTAVNNAERARRLLETGNTGAALALAKESLPLDGSLPFIPQAYDVVFRSVFARAQEVDVDLAGYHRSAPVVFPAGDHHYFIYNDTGTVAIWSPLSGVVYRRADLDWSKRPSLAPDSSAIFASGAQAMERLSLPDRIWSDIDLAAVFPDLSPPDYIAAIDATSLYACRNTELMKIVIDDELVGSTAWHIDLPAPCSALTITPQGGVVAGYANFAVEVDAQGTAKRLLGPAGDRLVERVYATADAVILSHVGGTYVYRGEQTEPLVIAGRGMDYFALSPDGRWFVYTDGDNERLVINDLTNGNERSLPCVCVFAGYLGDGQLLAASDRAVDAYSLDTLAPAGVVHTFGAEAETYVYLQPDNLLMALRRSGPESIAFLDETANPTRLLDGNTDLRTAMLSVAFTGTHSIVTRELGPDGIAFKLLDASVPVPGAGSEARLLDGEYRLASMTPLAAGKFAVTEPPDDNSDWSIHVFDGDSGAELWSATTLTDPQLRAGDRFIGTELDDELNVFDAASGKASAVPDGYFLAWNIEEDLLAGTYHDETGTYAELIRLGGGSPASLWTQPIDSSAYEICIAPQGGVLYLVRNMGDALQLERRSVDTGKLLTQLAVTDSTILDDGHIRAIIEADCDAASLRLVGLPSQQWRWDVAGGELLVEPRLATPPRSESPLVSGFTGLEQISDATIGWDDEGTWLYDPSDDRIVAQFASSGGRLLASTYLAQLGYAVLGFESGRIEVWDAQHPSAPMIELDAHTAPVFAVDYDPVRRLLLSADQQGSIYLWPLLPLKELLKRADAT